jgi:hypothetical protein
MAAAVLLSASLAVPAAADNSAAIPADPLILQIRILEGDGQVYALGGRASRGLTVAVTDEAGKPVANATVTFRLPEQGPSGVFANNARTEIATTNSDGRAVIFGMRWNRIPGEVRVRITALKGSTRAGAVALQVLSTSESVALSPTHIRTGKRRRWMWISLVAAAAAGGGLALGGQRSAPNTPAASVNVNIGNPTIILGGR